MNAVGLYVSAARLVLEHDSAAAATLTVSPATPSHPNDKNLLDLLRLLPHLRQSLSCAVCSRMLSDPYSLRDARCQHNVCRLCVRGRKNIRPSCTICRDCQDFKTYEENKQMRCLLLCYKSLCEHLMGSSLFQQICKQRAPPVCLSSGILVPTMSVQEFIMEGARYDDILSAFTTDLARPKLTQTAIAVNSAIPVSCASAPILKTTTSPIPQTQHTSHNTFPIPVVIKQEFGTTHQSTTSNAHITGFTKATTPSLSSMATPVVTTTPSMTLSTPPPPPPPALTIKSLKGIVDLSSAVQLTAASVASALHPTSTSMLPGVTYVSHAPVASGVVVPIVTSSSVSSAPLTIASAKLQSLSRQLAQQQQQRNLVNVSTGTNDLKPTGLTVKLTPATSSTISSSSVAASLGVTTTTATVTSHQVRNPPPIKTVSNGSAMYSVLYTGIGNKITIKRKTDGDDDGTQRKNVSTSSLATPTTVFRQVSKTNPKRRGCRCGNATPTPGKLTCCGQRCPCYVDSKSCIGCKCRGCRNPHRPDGGKVRPIIPELACYEIQMADSENSALSPGELPIATSVSTSSNKMISSSSTAATSTITAVQQVVEMPLDDLMQTQPQAPTISRLTGSAPTTSTTTTTTIQIPYRNLQQINAVHQHPNQQQQTHATLTSLSAQHNQIQQKQPQHIQLHQSTTQQQQPQANLLQLENLQRESLLIQSAEGKYQVVNVFTTTNTQHNQNSSLQRIHTLPQLQPTASNNMISNNNATYLLQSSSGNATITSAASTTAMQHQMPEISTTLPQIIMQQQQTQHNPNHQQQHLQRAHLQQQLKSHNNIITVHPISTQSGGTSQTKSAASSTIAPPSTITLSPIIVTSPNNSTFATTDLFSDTSTAEFLNTSNVSTTTISISTPSQHNIGHAPTFTISSNNNNISQTGVGGGVVVAGASNASGGASQQHLTPAYVEVIESNDL